MEAALTEVCKDIRVGKILIQTSRETGEPELYYLRLPKDIKDYRIILMDQRGRIEFELSNPWADLGLTGRVWAQQSSRLSKRWMSVPVRGRLARIERDPHAVSRTVALFLLEGQAPARPTVEARRPSRMCMRHRVEARRSRERWDDPMKVSEPRSTLVGDRRPETRDTDPRPFVDAGTDGTGKLGCWRGPRGGLVSLAGLVRLAGRGRRAGLVWVEHKGGTYEPTEMEQSLWSADSADAPKMMQLATEMERRLSEAVSTTNPALEDRTLVEKLEALSGSGWAILND